MATCLLQPSNAEDDSIVLFSTSNSPEGSTSPSSSFYHSPLSSDSSSKVSRKLTVRNLSYTIHLKRSSIPDWFSHLVQKPKPVEVLKSVSFVARSSEILAIVGASGTGKSSLLRIISGRVIDKDFDPCSIFMNEHRMTSPAQLRKICGFVAQEDNLLPLLTVRETLMFNAKFRLKEMSSKEKEERVDSLMQELGLLHVADSFVGDQEYRGISGGERKRVSIGVDMIHDPPILLLDEPTSGLDSTSALQVIEMLASMAKAKRRTVLLSIHQPSYRILRCISKFLVLSHGSVVHNGSLELLEETIQKLGFRIPTQLNALEFAMEIMPALEAASSKFSVPEDKESYSYPVWSEEECSRIQQHNDEKQMGNFWLSYLLEIMFLCSRVWKIIYRTKQLFLARTMPAIVGGLGLGSVYVKVMQDEEGIAA